MFYNIYEKTFALLPEAYAPFDPIVDGKIYKAFQI